MAVQRATDSPYLKSERRDEDDFALRGPLPNLQANAQKNDQQGGGYQPTAEMTAEWQSWWDSMMGYMGTPLEAWAVQNMNEMRGAAIENGVVVDGGPIGSKPNADSQDADGPEEADGPEHNETDGTDETDQTDQADGTSAFDMPYTAEQAQKVVDLLKQYEAGESLDAVKAGLSELGISTPDALLAMQPPPQLLAQLLGLENHASISEDDLKTEIAERGVALADSFWENPVSESLGVLDAIADANGTAPRVAHDKPYTPQEAQEVVGLLEQYAASEDLEAVESRLNEIGVSTPDALLAMQPSPETIAKILGLENYAGIGKDELIEELDSRGIDYGDVFDAPLGENLESLKAIAEANGVEPQEPVDEPEEPDNQSEEQNNGNYNKEDGKTIVQTIFEVAMAAVRSSEENPDASKIWDDKLTELGVFEALEIKDSNELLSKKAEDLVEFIADIFGMANPKSATKEDVAAYYKEKTGEDLPDSFWTGQLDYTCRVPFTKMLQTFASE